MKKRKTTKVAQPRVALLWKKVTGKVRQVHKRYEKPIRITGLVFMTIAIYACTFFYSWVLIARPSTPDQLEYLKEVAEDVNSQPGPMYEVPDDVDLVLRTSKMTLRLKNSPYMGKVVATLCNGELVSKDYSGTAGAITVDVCSGIISSAVFLLVYFYKKR